MGAHYIGKNVMRKGCRTGGISREIHPMEEEWNLKNFRSMNSRSLLMEGGGSGRIWNSNSSGKKTGKKKRDKKYVVELRGGDVNYKAGSLLTC